VIDPAHPDFANTPVSEGRPRRIYTLADLTAAPAVTIVTPFYDSGDVLPHTAESILRQSFQQWEWIIVNDGSTASDALALLQTYRGADPRIRVVDHETNQGLSGARNTGFREARAPYVVQLDSDDLLEPTAVEKWLWCLESHPELAFVNGYSVGFGDLEYLWRRGFHDTSAFLDENLVSATAMIRREVHRTVGGNDDTIRGGFEDWEFWLRCASHGLWGATIPEYLDWYRRREPRSHRWTNLADPERFRAQLRKRFPDLWNGQFPNVAIDDSGRAVSFTPADINQLTHRGPAVLMIVPWLTVGGVEKCNLDLVKQLTQRGWLVTVVATRCGDDDWLPRFTEHVPDVFILDHFVRLADRPRFLSYLVSSRRIDVVLVANSLLGYQLLPYLRAEHPDVTFAALSHVEERWRDGGFPGLSVAYEELLDINIVTSEHLRRWMLDRGAEPDRVQVTYTNVDIHEWHPAPDGRGAARSRLDLPCSGTIVLYVARLCEQKRPRVFARTVRELARGGLPFLAVVAGDGPDRQWLEAFIRDEHLAHCVRLLGAVPNERIRELMQAADVLFLPSQYEGIPVVTFEAMASGLCVVGGRVGGQSELVTPETGLLIDPGDDEAAVADYTDALTRLLREPDRMRRMGQAGRQRVQDHFRIEDMAAGVERALHDARRMHDSRPRPVPSRRLGRACAAEAVEMARIANATTTGRAAHEKGGVRIDTGSIDPYHAPASTLAYFTLRAALQRYYQAVTDRGLPGWLASAKDRTKRYLLRRG